MKASNAITRLIQSGFRISKTLKYKQGFQVLLTRLGKTIIIPTFGTLNYRATKKVRGYLV